LFLKQVIEKFIEALFSIIIFKYIRKLV